MTVNTRQEKILKSLATSETRLSNLLSEKGKARYHKKYGDLVCANGRMWWEICWENAVNGLKVQIAKKQEQLAKAKVLDQKESQKIRKIEKLNREYPEALRHFHKELYRELSENALSVWQSLRTERYPEPDDYSMKAQAIRKHFYMNKEEVLDETKTYCENLISNLYQRISEKVGNITDMDLYIGQGNWKEGDLLKGWVKGDKGECQIITIPAGGYNIQRLHVRCLVK